MCRASAGMPASAASMRVGIGNAKEQIFFETNTNRQSFYRIGAVKQQKQTVLETTAALVTTKAADCLIVSV